MTLFRVAQVTAHQQVGIDVVSGMESHVITHFGRPDFDEIMKQLAKRHNGETVGTFFCGPPVLAKTLERTCRRINKKSKTKFDFFKEHF
ncbi:hypothetical protein WJX72_005606 [[Myrmecia] bisecta]|uniref:Ferric reductase NAD binding domain-containing protein n=1 Tax=[Myrmecia] bisecta TaxID=41462 RepID=A0AAW1P5K9_9CHLO